MAESSTWLVACASDEVPHRRVPVDPTSGLPDFGALSPSDLVWTEGLSEWVTVASVRGPASTATAAMSSENPWDAASPSMTPGAAASPADYWWSVGPSTSPVYSGSAEVGATGGPPSASGEGGKSLGLELDTAALEELLTFHVAPASPPTSSAALGASAVGSGGDDQPSASAAPGGGRAMDSAWMSPPPDVVPPTVGAPSGFGHVLLEMVETERSYATSLTLVLQEYRPALQPLAPTALTPVFEALEAIQRTSEELLGRLEHVLEAYMLMRGGDGGGKGGGHRGSAYGGDGSDGGDGGEQRLNGEQLAAAALAQAFLPHGAPARGATGGPSERPLAVRGVSHPLDRYRPYVNAYGRLPANDPDAHCPPPRPSGLL